MDEKRLLSISETADRLSLGKSKVWELVSAGQLRPVRIGRSVRISIDELTRFVAKLQAERDDGQSE